MFISVLFPSFQPVSMRLKTLETEPTANAIQCSSSASWFRLSPVAWNTTVRWNCRQSAFNLSNLSPLCLLSDDQVLALILNEGILSQVVCNFPIHPPWKFLKRAAIGGEENLVLSEKGGLSTNYSAQWIHVANEKNAAARKRIDRHVAIHLTRRDNFSQIESTCR